MKASNTGILATIVGIFAVALLSGVGWIVVKLFDINSTVTMTANRVDRIVDALPELRVRIAGEELDKRIALVMLTRNPTEVSPGNWIRVIELLDYEHGRLTQFTLPARGADDQSAVYAVSGLANRIAIDKISFDEYSAAAIETGRAKPSPAWVDSSASYAIFRHRLDYYRRVSELFGKPTKEFNIGKEPLKWEQLVEELETHLRDGTHKPSPSP